MRARKAAVLGAMALGATLQLAAADTGQNPYQPIIERNAFGLKPPPPPQSDTPKEEQKPPPNVKLTGISNLFQKRALLEVTEQGAAAKPGQPASGTVHRPILAETEGAFGVEILAIDVEKNIVRIRNNGTESDLTFEAPKLSGPGTPGTTPGAQPGMPQPYSGRGSAAAPGQQQGQPTIISSSSQNSQTTGGGGVTMLGGGGTAGAQNNSGVTTYGGSGAPIPSPLGSESGLRTIPSRTVRTPNGAEQQQQVDPAQQAIMMEAQRLREQQAQQKYNRSGTVPPPLPTPFTPQNDAVPPPQPQQ